jgi:two-component system phosphate regulon sensor histidine kinase PhoR
LIFSSPLFRKLLLSAALLIAVAVLVLDFYLTAFLSREQAESVAQRLEAQARILAVQAARTPRDALNGWAVQTAGQARARITIIDRHGVVLADSESDSDAMEPHGARPEVRQALAGRVASSIRHSSTLNQDLCYLAYPMDGGAVLRVAVPMTSLTAAINAIRVRIVLVSLVAGAFALAIAYYASRVLTRRIRRIQAFAGGLLDARSAKALPPDANDELGDLAVTLSRMAAQLRDLIEKLGQESARLERVERVRKDFVANVSHELRTPLTAIRGYAETLLDGALEDKQNNRRFLEIIKAHTIRLNNIASDLLTLSELESGHSTSEPEIVSVRDVLETALRSVEAQARVQNVHIVCGKIEDLTVTGYRIRLEQALVNIIDNAVKFNRPGGEVRIECIRDTSGAARISVSDTGSGIPREDLSRIFERFYRVEKARSREVGGTGLGLSIVKHVVERMDGRITVESEAGAGSTFTITLPCQPARVLAL